MLEYIKAEEFLKAGFGVVGTHVQDGIARGTGTLVALNNYDASKRLVSNKVTNHFAFTRSAITAQSYPSSLMGMMALVRQMYYDMDWYKKGNSETKDQSLEALIANQNLVQLFTTEDKLNSLRASKIAKEFGLNYLMKGSGNEFERIDEIKNTNSKFIIPINFPEAYDVSDPNQANQMELKDFRFWNQAPSNLKVLADNGVVFALTTDNLKKMDSFKTNLLKAIQYGFDSTKALEALTTIPASILGKSKEIGSLTAGSQANFIITSGDYFDKKTVLHENWVQGSRYVVNDMTTKDIRGNYDLVINNETYKWKISGDVASPKSDITSVDNKKLNSKITIANQWLTTVIKPADSLETNFTRLSTYIGNTPNLAGKAIIKDGKEVNWSATKTSDFKADADAKKEEKINPLQPVTYPNVAFGNQEKLTAQTLLFKNATIWTNEKEGILENTDVLIKDGKIAAVGKNLSDPSATVIDAKGKHLTSGIIDEHSHIAISKGVNEGGHNSSAEVTIQDVVNSEDPNIYRDLAGGVTISQLLHGSANPIGGRAAFIKLKWGYAPDEMLVKDAPKYIKFALGENVKQSNWGDFSRNRFPQSRMGVEQVYEDYFTRAIEYKNEWDTYKSGKNKKMPRFDVEMEVLGEILAKKRFITCHSYVQSEINMLMKLAERYGFKIQTFTHILEGYKLADKMSAHGVAGSTFADWWAYKYEVNDAIPYNASIMMNEGVKVSINSDDAEMSRRLNQEAAKTVKYGNVTEEEAWNFVTLNPAKILQIDNKVGSIKVGKDADVVLWSDSPLSIYTRAEKTLVDGIIFYDLEKEQEVLNQIQKERADLINILLDAKNKGMKTQLPKKKENGHYHCDTLGEYCKESHYKYN